MNPRTRAVLSVLGVPVWAARHTRVQTISPSPVWQDQVKYSPSVSSEPVSRLEPREQVTQAVLPHPSPSTSHTVPHVVIQPPPVAKLPPQTPPSRPQTPHTKPVVAEATAIRFAVEVLVLRSWLLVVPSQQLEDVACRQLWEQIQTVFAQQPVDWFWPLAEGIRWQTAPYAAVALQGFFTRLHPQARVGLMGELPDQVLPDRVERLPSLSSLIEQPLHKRTLWQLLKSEIKTS